MANIFTQAGEEFVIDQIDAFGTFYVGWGTGAGTAAKGDTTLFTEAAEARVAATKSQPVADKIRWVGQITAGGTKTITNAGVLTLSSGGILLVHGDHAGVALVAGDKIEYTIELEMT
jgi:hypothetical protein